MLAKRLIMLLAAFVIGWSVSPAQAQSHTREQIEVLAQYYAQYYGVPLELVRRVINRESTFNPSARNGPYYGLMQILPATARTMGFRGEPSELLNAETNLIYAVKYLRGAWMLANGSHDRAVQLYAKGYYYEAKAAGLLEETGLRPGPASPAAPQPPQFGTPVVAAATPPAPAPAPAVDTIAVAAISQQEIPTSGETAIAPLGFLPPARPLGLTAEEETAEPSEALAAIAAAEAPPAVPIRPQSEPAAAAIPASASIEPGEDIADSLRPSVDLVANTFALLDSMTVTRP